jgi:hypothetical protein
VIEDARAALNARCDTIEECYEFMLAYAAQGTTSEGPEIRDFLGRADQALTTLATLAAEPGGPSDSPYAAFMAVIDRDARNAQAAVRLVLAQKTITSPLIDNLNASIHLRALLTDLFLIDEALSGQRE